MARPTDDGDLERLTAENAALRQRLADRETEPRAAGPTAEPVTTPEHLVRHVIADAHEGIAVYGPDLRYMYWNPFMERLSGKSADEVVGRHPLDVFPFLADAGIAQRLKDVLAGATFNAMEFAYDSPRGRRWLVESTIPLPNETGHVVGAISIVQDVTERREAKKALARSEQRLELIFQHTTDMLGLIEVDPSGSLRYAAVNRRYLDAGRANSLDLHEADFVGREVDVVLREVLHFDDAFVADEMARLQQAIAGRQPLQFERQVDTPIGPVHIETNLVPVLDERGTCTHLLWSSRDVTARRRAEADRAALQQQLFHAQKMEAIGTLAGGVAHDFNNILGGLMSGLSLLELDAGGVAARHHADVEDMKGLVQRGAELARQLLGFSRRGKYDVAPRDVRQIVQATVAMFGRTRRDITIVLDFAPGVDAALMDHAQLEQALLNLFINSSHAMPGGGQLSIRAENAVVRDDQAATLDVSPGRFVRLIVADTGAGIAPDVLPRIFEPFFTTKEAGQGSGLGLAAVYGIIKNHGGAIRVESDVAKGTTFTILLPAADAPVRGAVAAASGAHTGHGTILVVDDEELPLKLSARLLSSLGYRVLTASSGREAIDLVRQGRDSIALVVLDLTMPQMSGAATFDQLRAIDPTLKVLLASGYSVEGQAQALLDRGCDGFIQKPFSASALSAKIRSLGIA